MNYYLKYEKVGTGEIITIPCQVVKHTELGCVWYGVRDENDGLLGDGADTPDEAIGNAICDTTPDGWDEVNTIRHGFFVGKPV